MIECTLRELLQAQRALEQLCQLDFPMETTFALAMDIGKLNVPLTTYEKQQRELITKYGGPIPNQPGDIGVLPHMPGFVEFTEKHNALLDVILKLDIKPISKKFLLAEAKKVKKGEENTLKIATVLQLGQFLTD